MCAGSQRPPLGSAEVLVRELGEGLPAGEASAFGFGVPVAEDLAVGLGTSTDGVGAGGCQGLPYAADGSPSGPWAATLDEAVTLDRCAAERPSGEAG